MKIKKFCLINVQKVFLALELYVNTVLFLWSVVYIRKFSVPAFLCHFVRSGPRSTLISTQLYLLLPARLIIRKVTQGNL